jgi:diacylglycerol kinase family enzyme
MRTYPSTVPVRRRLAAIVAIVGAIALVVLVVVVLIRHGVSLLIGLLGWSALIAGGWWLVTERMPRRLVGIAGVAVGTALLVVSVAVALDDGGHIALGILVLVVVSAITLGSARGAMVHAVHHLDLRVRPGGPPPHAVLLCNPKSGGGKVAQFGLIELAGELGVEAVVLNDDSDLEQLARDAVARGADCLGMAGGDGSQALVASIAIENHLPFVCVSAGTRNHFALDLGLDHNDPRKSMYAFRDAIERRVDYATVNGRLFVNNVSLGVYAEIVQHDSYRDAKFGTTTSLLPDLLNAHSEPFDLQFTTTTGEQVDGAIVVMISNNPYVLAPTPENAQRPRLDSGRLGVFAVTTRTGGEAARLFASAAIGRRARSPFWHEFDSTEFEVRSRSGHAYAGVDGEAFELSTPMRFAIHPHGLTLLVPRGNVEAAERRRARDVGLTDLVTIAAGHEPAPRL